MQAQCLFLNGGRAVLPFRAVIMFIRAEIIRLTWPNLHRRILRRKFISSKDASIHEMMFTIFFRCPQMMGCGIAEPRLLIGEVFLQASPCPSFRVKVIFSILSSKRGRLGCVNWLPRPGHVRDHATYSSFFCRLSTQWTLSCLNE